MAFRSSKQVNGPSSTTVTGTQPAGVVSGDQLLAFVAEDTPGNTHTSTGATWAKLDNTSISGPDGQTLSLWARVATGTDTFSLSSTGGGQRAVTIAAFSGRNASTSPTFSVTTPNTTANASPVTVTLTGVTAAAGDDIAAWYDLDVTSDTVTCTTTTTPAALTLREDCLPSLQWCPSALATADNVSAGATGNEVFVATGATMTAGFGGYVVTLPAASGGTPVQHTENAARARPGRGPFSKRTNGFLVSSIDAYQNIIAAALQGTAIDSAQATGGLTTRAAISQTDWGQSRNRPGRGPLSMGRFFLPSIDAFTQPPISAALQGAASDVVNAAGALTTAILMAGSASDSATATANLSTAINLAVNAIATATASGALTTAILLSGSASDSVIATGSLAGTAAALAGAATDVVTATGQLITGIPIAGSAQDIANATGALTTQIKLQAAAQAIATAAGNLATQIQLVGAAIDTAIATGSITGGALLSGAAQAVANAGGSLTTAIQLLGSAADQATAAGALSTGIKLSGSASDIVVATGSLASNAAALVGAAQSIVTAIGILSTGIPLGGGAIVAASAQGSLLTSIRLLGAAQSAVIAHGALTTVALYYASALTLRVPRREYTLSIQRRDFTVTLH